MLKIIQTLSLGIIASSLHGSDGKPFISGHNVFMKEIKLTQGQVALVDDEDFGQLDKHNWVANKIGNTFYAVSRNGNSTTYMHRFILEVFNSKVFVDHRDRNGLNNQRYNLRLATVSQNCSNKVGSKNSISKYLGVTWHKRNKRWQASINSKYIGHFKDEKEAALAYNEAAKIIHGEFANLNTL